ncbi:MAG: hypothetical protein H0T49_10620, partial [Chloroflexia bacterium]|nr:hypothetical protein [Chloroflexia bacterium]
GADGKMSLARRWIGAETISDPEHHRFGGVLLERVEADRSAVHNAPAPGTGGIWFAQSATVTRLYLSLPAERVRATGAGRSLAAFLAVAAGIMPEGALANARRVGPMGFFPNSDVWSSRIAGERVVLIGDAAGAADPSLGHGTSLLFRDVRELNELLLAGPNWDTAIAEFARRRREYFAVIRAKDQWYASLTLDEGIEADRRRERHALAKEQDPTLGGFALLEERGPDGLVPDEAARRVYFGECAS